MPLRLRLRDRAAARGPGASGPLPRPHGPLLRAGPYPLWYAALGPGPSSLGLVRPLFAQGPSGTCAGAPAPARVRSRARRPPPASRPRSVAWLPRRCSRLAGAGPRLLPPRSRAPPFAASFLRPSSGRRWPRLPLGPALLCCGRPPPCSGCPCSARPWPACSAWPRGGAAARPFGLRARGSPAPAPPGLRPVVSPSGGRGFKLRARARPRLLPGSWCAAAVSALLGLAWALWLCFALAGARHRCSPRRAAAVPVERFSLAPLPSPPPPLGAPGEREASGLGAPAPALRAPPHR